MTTRHRPKPSPISAIQTPLPRSGGGGRRSRSEGGVTQGDAPRAPWPVLTATLVNLILTLALTRPAIAIAQDAPRPNIVLIVADDLGFGDLACYGSTDQHTPHLDALTAQGIRFTDFHTNGVVCSPTRAALLTGRYQQRTGIEGVVTAANHREGGMPLSEVTVAELLRDAGYTTAMFGKWHLGYTPEFGPTQQGFDTFEGFVSGNIDYVNKIDQVGEPDWWIGDALDHQPGYLTTVIADRAVDWLAAREDDAPFFLYLAHGAPHYPYQGPHDEGFREPGHAQVQGPRRDRDAAYREMITALDVSVGRVVTALREHNLERNTLLIFCSDNGPAGVGSAGPFRGRKGRVYEGGHRVPMIACWPGTLDAGTESDALVLGMDLPPTFAALAGATPPDDLTLDGIDLAPLLAGTPDPDRTVYWHTSRGWAARQGPWKLVQLPDQDPQLYHLTDDPGESQDLAADHPDRVEQMLADHADWLHTVRESVEPISR